MTTSGPLSRPALALATTGLAAGVITGAVQYAAREPAHTHGSAATAAWSVHLVLTGLAVLALIGAAVLARRRGERLPVLLSAPLRQRATSRLMAGLCSPARLLPTAVLTFVLVYCSWRIGEQVTAGFDENFRADAWGGPSYLGAMYCHYLDTGLIVTVVALLLHLVLPGRRAQSTRSAYSG